MTVLSASRWPWGTNVLWLVDVGDKIVDQHPTIPLRRHAAWLLGWLTRPPDGIPDVVEAVARHTHRAKVIGGEVLGGGAAALPEFAAIAAEIYAGNQHTHANPPEQLLAGQLLLPLCGQPLACQLQHEIQLLRWHHVDECSKWRHVREVRVSRCNPLAGRPFLVPLTTGRGLVGDVANDRLSIAVDPFLLVGNRPDAMHREVGRRHKHRRSPKVDGLGGLLLAGRLALLRGRGQ